MQSKNFTIFYQDRDFRICTVSRLNKISQQGIEFVDLSPTQTIAVEMRVPNQDYYIVICFVRNNNSGSEPIIEPVEDREEGLGILQKRHYIKIQRKAIQLMKDFTQGGSKL